jgi:hypothetical protein
MKPLWPCTFAADGPARAENRSRAGAPKGNQNASRRPSAKVLGAYKFLLREGCIKRSEIAAELGVSTGTTYRWIPVE